jgi:hypothetical protein
MELNHEQITSALRTLKGGEELAKQYQDAISTRKLYKDSVSGPWSYSWWSDAVITIKNLTRLARLAIEKQAGDRHIRRLLDEFLLYKQYWSGHYTEGFIDDAEKYLSGSGAPIQSAREQAGDRLLERYEKQHHRIVYGVPPCDEDEGTEMDCECNVCNDYRAHLSGSGATQTDEVPTVPPPTCVWIKSKQVRDKYLYKLGCNIEAVHPENEVATFKFCPYCGLPIEEEK